MAVKTYTNDAGVKTEVDEDKCTGCGECVDSCAVECLTVENEKCTAPNLDECVECCACVEACPEGALKHSSCD